MTDDIRAEIRRLLLDEGLLRRVVAEVVDERVRELLPKANGRALEELITPHVRRRLADETRDSARQMRELVQRLRDEADERLIGSEIIGRAALTTPRPDLGEYVSQTIEGRIAVTVSAVNAR